MSYYRDVIIEVVIQRLYHRDSNHSGYSRVRLVECIEADGNQSASLTSQPPQYPLLQRNLPASACQPAGPIIKSAELSLVVVGSELVKSHHSTLLPLPPPGLFEPGCIASTTPPPACRRFTVAESNMITWMSGGETDLFMGTFRTWHKRPRI
jgi:hypothetical protein